jgi:hypothetical protein
MKEHCTKCSKPLTWPKYSQAGDPYCDRCYGEYLTELNKVLRAQDKSRLGVPPAGLG